MGPKTQRLPALTDWSTPQRVMGLAVTLPTFNCRHPFLRLQTDIRPARRFCPLRPVKGRQESSLLVVPGARNHYQARRVSSHAATRFRIHIEYVYGQGVSAESSVFLVNQHAKTA